MNIVEALNKMKQGQGRIITRTGGAGEASIYMWKDREFPDFEACGVELTVGDLMAEDWVILD